LLLYIACFLTSTQTSSITVRTTQTLPTQTTTSTSLLKTIVTSTYYGATATLTISSTITSISSTTNTITIKTTTSTGEVQTTTTTVPYDACLNIRYPLNTNPLAVGELDKIDVPTAQSEMACCHACREAVSCVVFRFNLHTLQCALFINSNTGGGGCATKSCPLGSLYVTIDGQRVDGQGYGPGACFAGLQK